MVFTSINSVQWKQVKEIYLEAFPKAERKPFFLLKKSSKANVFTAIEDEEVLGFIVAIPFENLVMVDYLAVNSKIRSKGTGSFLLKELCNKYKDKKIVLLIEQLDDKADNQEQRIARRKFYLKNGFTSSNLLVKGISGTMEIMNYGQTISKTEYLNLQKYSLGKILFKLSKMELVTD